MNIHWEKKLWKKILAIFTAKNLSVCVFCLCVALFGSHWQTHPSLTMQDKQQISNLLIKTPHLKLGVSALCFICSYFLHQLLHSCAMQWMSEGHDDTVINVSDTNAEASLLCLQSFKVLWTCSDKQRRWSLFLAHSLLITSSASYKTTQPWK